MSTKPIDTKILGRVLKGLEIPNLVEKLSEQIPASDLQTLLLEVYRRRVAKLDQKTVLKQYMDNRFVQLPKNDLIESMKFDLFAYSMLPKEFEVIELSPIVPLGSCTVLGPVHQNNVITTIRNTEVCSDPTNILALETSKRLAKRINNQQQIDLCTSHRIVRGQLFTGAASFPHFRVLSLCSAGYDLGNYAYEIEILAKQIMYYLQLLIKAEELAYKIKQIRIEIMDYGISDFDQKKELIIRKIEKTNYQSILYESKKEESKYYQILGFHIYVRAYDDEEYFLVDGGFTDWTQKLLNNRKERFLISGMGTERFLYCFKE